MGRRKRRQSIDRFTLLRLLEPVGAALGLNLAKKTSLIAFGVNAVDVCTSRINRVALARRFIRDADNVKILF